MATVAEAAKAWDHRAPLAIVCRSGARSGKATLLLESMGFVRVVSLQGGMVAWNREGLPTTRAPISAKTALGVAALAPTVVFATDLDDAEEPVLATAVSLAIASGAKLVTVHASVGAAPTGALPQPERLARQWGRELSCDTLIHSCCEDVTDTLLDALRRLKPNLVVCGSHRRRGLSLLVADSVAESLARNSDVPTLVVPLESGGLADRQSGQLEVHRLIIPVGDVESARVGLAAAEWLARETRLGPREIVLLEVEDGSALPLLAELPAGHRVRREAPNPSFEIAVERAAGELGTSLLVVPTRGHDGVADALFGSHAEHVLRAATRPTLIVPMNARLSPAHG